jgi:hypothetical protein
MRAVALPDRRLGQRFFTALGHGVIVLSQSAVLFSFQRSIR